MEETELRDRIQDLCADWYSQHHGISIDDALALYREAAKPTVECGSREFIQARLMSVNAYRASGCGGLGCPACDCMRWFGLFADLADLPSGHVFVRTMRYPFDYEPSKKELSLWHVPNQSKIEGKNLGWAAHLETGHLPVYYSRVNIWWFKQDPLQGFVRGFCQIKGGSRSIRFGDQTEHAHGIYSNTYRWNPEDRAGQEWLITQLLQECEPVIGASRVGQADFDKYESVMRSLSRGSPKGRSSRLQDGSEE